MTVKEVVCLKWVFPDGVPIQETRYRFISFVISLLFISAFTIGAVVYVLIDRVNNLEQAGKDVHEFQARTVNEQKLMAADMKQASQAIKNAQENLLKFESKTTFRFLSLETSNKATLRWRMQADSSDAIFQQMYLQQYRDYQILLDAEKLKQGQQKDTIDGTFNAR